MKFPPEELIGLLVGLNSYIFELVSKIALTHIGWLFVIAAE